MDGLPGERGLKGLHVEFLRSSGNNLFLLSGSIGMKGGAGLPGRPGAEGFPGEKGQKGEGGRAGLPGTQVTFHIISLLEKT